MLLNTTKQLRNRKLYFSVCDTLNEKKDFVRTRVYYKCISYKYCVYYVTVLKLLLGSSVTLV